MFGRRSVKEKFSAAVAGLKALRDEAVQVRERNFDIADRFAERAMDADDVVWAIEGLLPIEPEDEPEDLEDEPEGAEVTD